MFAENICRMLPGKGLRKPQPLRNLAEDPPVRFGLPVQPETRVAGRYSVPNWSPCHFSPPAQGGQQDMRGAGGVRVTQNVGHNNQRTTRQTGPHAIGIRK